MMRGQEPLRKENYAPQYKPTLRSMVAILPHNTRLRIVIVTSYRDLIQAYVDCGLLSVSEVSLSWKKGKNQRRHKKTSSPRQEALCMESAGNVELVNHGVRMIPDKDTIVSCKGLGRESIRWERAEEHERTNEKN